MSLHRHAVALVVGLAVVTAGCTDDTERSEPSPVTAGRSTTTTVAPTTSTTTTSPVPTTTIAAPPVTKPLTTAPPSPLLTEVTAAYDAAYADLISASLAGNPDDPALGNHMADGQRDQWREVIRRMLVTGLRAEPRPATTSWSRVEAINEISTTQVQLNVCRYDNTESVDQTGAVVEPSTRAFRYLETMELAEGGWKWAGREWVDQSPDASDCAQP